MLEEKWKEVNQENRVCLFVACAMLTKYCSVTISFAKGFGFKKIFFLHSLSSFSVFLQFFFCSFINFHFFLFFVSLKNSLCLMRLKLKKNSKVVFLLRVCSMFFKFLVKLKLVDSTEL
jgi:hypothetical protein